MHVCACVYIYGRRFVIVIFMFSCIDLASVLLFSCARAGEQRGMGRRNAVPLQVLPAPLGRPTHTHVARHSYTHALNVRACV